jgi:hypothetical protein
VKYLDEYRDGNIARKLVDEMRRIQTRPWVIMEVCGGQTHSIVKHGIAQFRSLLALWRSHVFGQWQSTRDSAFPNVRCYRT